MKQKHLKIVFLALVGLISFLVAAYGTAKGMDALMNRAKEFMPERGYVGTKEMQEMQEKLEGALCVEGRYPAYYAGAYSQNYNLVVHLTVASEARKKEITDILGKEDGVVFRQVEYSLNELQDAQEKFGERLQAIVEEGDEDLKSLLGDLSVGVEENKNRVIVSIYPYSKRKVRKMKKLFGDYEIVQYEKGGKHVQTND